MKTVTMPDGQKVTFAPAGFSQDVVELIELIEDPEKIKGSFGRALRLMRAVVKDCVVRGGKSEAEAEAFLCSIPLGEEMFKYLDPAKEAIGID